MRNVCLLLAMTAIAMTLLGCGNSGPRVTRLDPNQPVDLSGNWNAADSRATAQALIQSVLNEPWHNEFREKHQRNPRVQVHRVVVRSSGDIIDTQIITNDIVNEFIRSRKVQAFSATDERDDTREVLRDQDVHASADTRKEAFQETASDFILRGTILVQDDQAQRVRHRYYQTTLNLTNIQTQEMVWSDSHTISKEVVRRR